MSFNNENTDKLRTLFRDSVITALCKIGITDEHVDEYIEMVREKLPLFDMLPPADHFENLIDKIAISRQGKLLKLATPCSKTYVQKNC